MFRNLGFVGVSRVFLILAQVFVVYLLAQNYSAEDLGTYMLLVGITLPVLNFLLLDAPSKVLSGTVKSRNVLEVLGLKLLIAVTLLLVTIFLQLADFGFSSEFLVLLCAIFYMKAGQGALELEMAQLKKEENFKELFLVIIKSQVSIYLVMALMMLAIADLIFVYAAGALVSCCMATLSIIRLLGKDWVIEFGNPFGYIKSEFHLGAAIGIKSLSSNLLRYVAVGIYGITSFGYMAPAFYALTILSNLGSVVENTVTPRVLKRLDMGEFGFAAHKADFLFVFIISLVIALGFYFLADEFYGIFFPGKIEEYSGMIIIFSLGYFFYVSRAVMKIISFKVGLEAWQVYLQILFGFALVLSMLLLRDLAGVNGLALSYITASIFICFVYLIAIRRNFSEKIIRSSS